MSTVSRLTAVFIAASLGLGADGALADGYESGGSLKDTRPAPVAYQWDGFSIGAGIGAGRFAQDADAYGRRKETAKKI